jgi:hypothetical protein
MPDGRTATELTIPAGPSHWQADFIDPHTEQVVSVLSTPHTTLVAGVAHSLTEAQLSRPLLGPLRLRLPGRELVALHRPVAQPSATFTLLPHPDAWNGKPAANCS